MNSTCPQCKAVMREEARYCARCGASRDGTPRRAGAAGHTIHPRPLTHPGEMRACGGGPDLYFQWGAASGGQALLGTETLAIRLFNAGYGLKDAVLEIDGLDASGQEIFSIRQTAEELPRGREYRMEVPSYEVPSDPADLTVTLLSADLSNDS